MKTFNPNPDLWSRIIKRKAFDQQLQDNIDKLPTRDPNTELWGKIEKELGQTKKRVIWYYLGAAVVAMFLLVSGISYYMFTQPIDETPFQAEENQAIVPQTPLVGKDEATGQKILEKTTNNQQPLPRPYKTSPFNRVEIKPIIIATKLENTLEINPSLALREVEISRPIAPSRNSYHEIKISWAAEKPTNIFTPFGKKEKIKVASSSSYKAAIQVKLINSKK